MRMKRWPFLVAAILSLPAFAGPPYLTDDPQPTGEGHYENYFFMEGAAARDGSDGSAGIDFNYGAANDLQLTAVLPIGWSRPSGGPSVRGFGNIELAAKYKFLHQQGSGVDVAFFPRLFLPAGDAGVGERRASLLLPLWLQHTWDGWSAFGGGGCEIHRGGGARDFCQLGLALTKQALRDLQIGVELYHQTPDTDGARVSTDLNVGVSYDLDSHLHVMASIGTGLQNRAQTDRTIWYAALLWTL
jgi:hypothetical protein